MNYGAVGDGNNLDSPAVNAAIAAAGAAGGGTVVFPPGNYLCGSIHLTNNLTLYLSNGAVILCSTNNIDTHESNPYSGYQDAGHSYFHDAQIWGENLTNLMFAGPGKIDGNKGLTTGNPSGTQPGDKALCLVMCTNVVITGITITNGGHFGILAQACYNMMITNMNIEEKTSRDGFNLIDSSFVTISNCLIEGSDDSMCLKSTYALGRGIGSQHVHISHCTILSTENNATQFGSETVSNFTDYTFSDLVITGAGKAGIGITSQDGAIIDGVTYDNIIMSNCACPIFLKLDHRITDTPTPSIGRIRNISFNNVSAYHSTLFNRTNTSTINGYLDNTNPMVPIENITFNNVYVSNIGGNPASAITNYPVENTVEWQPQSFGKWPSYGWYLRWADNISFTNCQAHFDNNDDRPAVVVDNVTNVLFNNFSADVGTGNTNYDMGFLDSTSGFDVLNATASASSPSPGAALRIFNSNSISASVVSPPYFSPGDGVYSTTQMVSIASGTPGATIHYTTDGSTATSSNGTVYTGPIAISSETVLHAVASASGMVDSADNTAIYSFAFTTPTAAAPVFNPPGGTYAATQPVTITSTPGASIWFTTDGSTPSPSNGTLYSGPLIISSNVVLNAVAYASGMLNSTVTSAGYIITGVAGTPVFSVPGGILTNAQLITISSSTQDSSIRYTTDGSTPSEAAGTLYSAPVPLTSALMLNAIAYAPGASDSQVASAFYAVVNPLNFEAESIPFVTNGAVAAVQSDSSSSGGKWMALEAANTGPYIEYTLANVPAGTYQLNLKWKGNTQRGIITHSVDGVALGDSLDQYSSSQIYPVTDLGVFTFTTNGSHTVRQTVIGKNPSASNPWASADVFILQLLQPPVPSFASEAVQTNGIQFTGSGYPTLGYIVQTSTNLSAGNWVDAGSISADTNGVLQYLETNAAAQSAQFYRFVTP